MKHLSAIVLAGVLLSSIPSARAQVDPLQGTWTTTLHGRDLNGDQVADAYYDSTLDITWLADANANPASYGAGYPPGFTDWNGARQWTQNLNVFGVTGWRLPTVSPVNGSFFQYTRSTDGSTDFGSALAGTGWGTASEMGHMYYVTLGNSAGAFSNSGPFTNLQQHGGYWPGTEYDPVNAPGFTWAFSFGSGNQFGWDEGCCGYAWAVRSGDVAPIPEPRVYALLLAGLGLLGMAARRRA